MTDGNYSGQVVAVTGSRKGLGHDLALHFLSGGAQVLGLGRQPGVITHPLYRHYECDVREAGQVRSTFQEIGREFSLHVLINNSAVLDSQHSLMLTATSAQEMLNTNLLGPFLVSREAAKIMKRSKYGRIINIGSMAAALAPSGDSIYAATKSGLVTMAAVLAREFASFGVTCNTVGVTAIESDMLSQLPRDAVDRVVADLPIPRYAELDDVVNVVDFLASPRSSYITAQTVYLGGVRG